MENVLSAMNRNEKARRMLAMFENMAEANDWTGDEYRNNRADMVALIIASVPTLRDQLADEVYDAINAA